MRALVTGGGGFLGEAIVRRLRARGDEVRSLARGDYPALREIGVDVHRGDIGDSEAVHAAAEGCDVVFHVAAKAGIWGPYEEYHRANVVGTENVIGACRAHGIGKLVHTSSPSVVFDGEDQEGVDETTPYPEHFLAHYPRTKAEAERLVLAANDNELATVALRPHLIWGPGDNHLVPRVIARARAGKLRLVGGRPTPAVDSVYIDNAADAHLDAEARLAVGSPVAGKAYFISQGEPVPLSELIDGILGAAELPPVDRSVSPRAAYVVGSMLEAVYGLFRIESEPVMTRFLARQLATAHWFDISAAKEELGYEPKVDISEGLERLSAWLSEEER